MLISFWRWIEYRRLAGCPQHSHIRIRNATTLFTCSKEYFMPKFTSAFLFGWIAYGQFIFILLKNNKKSIATPLQHDVSPNKVHQGELLWIGCHLSQGRKGRGELLSKQRFYSFCQFILFSLGFGEVFSQGREIGLDLRLGARRANDDGSSVIQRVD